MKVNLDLFDSIFPNYHDFRIPMWSTGTKSKEGFYLEIAVPGHDKDDFNLYEEDGNVFLSIKMGEDSSPLEYDILDKRDNWGYDLEKIDAKYKSGVLKITIPKTEIKPEQRRIGIS
jgi:HSP20 family molecular chaperone IbpA